MITTIGVVVPAHDEEDQLPGCIAALRAAVRHPGVTGVRVIVVVVLDACSDQSADVARRDLSGSEDAVLTVEVRAVGAARAAGVDHVLDRAGVTPQRDIWLATTDADSRVRPDWLAEQRVLADEGVDAVAGVIEILDWSAHPLRVRRAYEGILAGRLLPGERHAHVYGASLGCRASAYRDVGGFEALRTHEDRRLWTALGAAGHRTVGSTRVAVVTSGRRTPRAPEGLGHLLLDLAISERAELGQP